MAKQQEVSFTVPASVAQHIQTIIDRVATIIGPGFDRVSTRMDLCATHANGCPLDFERLAQADDFNLIHDVGGIRTYLDRKTGKLTNCFLPRFASRDAVRSRASATPSDTPKTEAAS